LAFVGFRLIIRSECEVPLGVSAWGLGSYKDEILLLKRNKVQASTIVVTICLLIQISAQAGSIVSPRNGTVYRFGEWSKATLTEIACSNGPIAVIRQECEVKVEPVRFAHETRRLQVLYFPAANEMWVGEPFDRYLMVGQKIWGISQNEGQLKIRVSRPAEDAGNGQDLNLATFISKFLDDPDSMFWDDGTLDSVWLHRVFGLRTLYGKNVDIWQHSPPVELTNVSVTGNKVSVGFRITTDGSGLSLSLNEKREIVEAFVDGKSLPVLWRSFEFSMDLGNWICPSIKGITSANGLQEALSCTQEYSELDSAGESHLLARVKSVVLIATGDLWIGPDICDVFVIGSRIVGVSVDSSTRELQFFLGPQVRLPLRNGTSEAYVAEIRKFESALRFNQYRLSPDYRIDLSAVFAGDIRFDSNCEFAKRKLSLSGDHLVVGLSSGKPGAASEITVGSDLRMISSRVLRTDDPELLPPPRSVAP
jgi:hypothetical protein